MYIEDRLFSEYSGETLYSVMLNEDEYALFSELLQKNYVSIRLAKKGYKLRAAALKRAKRKLGWDLKKLTSTPLGREYINDILRENATLKIYNPDFLRRNLLKANGKTYNKLANIIGKESNKIKDLTGGNLSQLYGAG